MKIYPCGDRAICVELGQDIDPQVNAQVIAFARQIEALEIAGIMEVVPTYRSLLIHYDPLLVRGAEIAAHVAALPVPDSANLPARCFSVPVVYGGAVGQDLADIAKAKGMTEEQVIALHTTTTFRVYMIGFAPGFTYLGGLPPALHMPRLAQPRQMVPAGAIGIGGQQASINSVAGPSGWRYIGQTPVAAFDATRDPPFLFRAGDLIRFRAVADGVGEGVTEWS